MPQTGTLNLDLLRFLKRQDRPVMLADIEEALDVEHGRLIGQLDDLAGEGYEIEVHPYLGVRLIDVPDRLIEHEIKEDLNSKIIGSKLHIYNSCSSTNDEAWRIIESGGGEDGELVVAEHQSSGRGRMGRMWESQRGAGLYLSFISRLKMPPDKLPYMTSAAALALANTIQQFVHLPAEIKWPNDILIGPRKTAGILVESRSNIPDTFVVGIGVNVNQRLEDFSTALSATATSLRIERRGGAIHRIRLLRPLLFYLDSVYAQLKKRKFDRISRAWQEFVTIVGKRVIVRVGSDELSGTLLAIDPGEGVRLKLSDGSEKTFKPEHVLTVRVAT